MIPQFVRYKQENGSYCGPAVVQMLLSSIGVEKTQSEIADAYASRDVVTREGIPVKGLIKAIKKIDPSVCAWQKYNSSLEDIEKLLAQGFPVGFDWQGIFDHDEYGDEYWNFQSKWKRTLNELRGVPQLTGDQGHYCIALEIDRAKGYLRFADPYGHYAGKDRFVALWELEERWWDDRLDKDENGKVVRVLEERLIFLLTKVDDTFPASLGMERM